MKTILKFIAISFLFLHSQAESAPYYRFWRGWKLDSLTRAQFENGLNVGFLSNTVGVGAGRGLVGYLPVLLPVTPLKYNIPDEIALVIYSTETQYAAIRNAPVGKAYGDSHWLIFDQSKGSKSLIPEAYSGSLATEKAYDILQSNANWQAGEGIFITSKIDGDIRPYINLMKTDFSRRGLVSYVVLIQGSILYEYQLWRDKASLQANWSHLRDQAAKHKITYSAQLSTVLKKQDWKKPLLVPGLGLNVIF